MTVCSAEETLAASQLKLNFVWQLRILPGVLARTHLVLCNAPPGKENELCNLLHLVKVNLVYCISRLVIIFVRPSKIEDEGNSTLGEIVVITPVIEAIGIIKCIIPVIQ